MVQCTVRAAFVKYAVRTSMSVSSSGPYGESAKENIRRAFDSMPATTRQEEWIAAAARNEKKNVECVLQFLFEMRDCGIVFRAGSP